MPQRRTRAFVAFLPLFAACAAPEPARDEPAQVRAQPPPAPEGADLDLTSRRAADALLHGDPREALAQIDEAQQLAPLDARLWLLRGRACLAAAERDPQAGLYYIDARAAFERAAQLEPTAEAWFGASRAARMSLDADAALDFARRGAAAATVPSSEQRRVAAEASFDAYVARRQGGEEAGELYRETEAHLLDLALAKDAWALAQLANLYEWAESLDAAYEVLSALVEVAPEDERAHERLSAALRARGGRGDVLSFYESFRARHASSALGAWHLARETFEAALEGLLAAQDVRDGFARAEDLFRASRSSNAAYESACLGYEAMCRCGVGWCRFNAGDLAGAESAFLSMEDLFAGAMEWQIEGRLPSGVKGLQFVADRAVRGAPDENDIDGNAKAARIYARLHAYRPDDAGLANNCGFFHREAGVASALAAAAARDRAQREGDAVARERLDAKAAELDRQARSLLHACRDAYLAAARLANDDVRVVNDAALILVYHFPSMHEEAERLLRHAAELGAAQKDGVELSEQARDVLLEAWGDVYQNLGLLALLRNRPDDARRYYERSHEIGPRPRVDRAWIPALALPLCDRLAKGEAIDIRALDPRVVSME